ncbi:hypothetical protein ZEAMMB73_Zm00001d000096 [Zea mays]|nr:hypothetical protein ZEAMMB73_Zm00001d000096 [Zea mays]
MAPLLLPYRASDPLLLSPAPSSLFLAQRNFFSFANVCFPRFISSAWQGSRQAPASCSTSTSGRRPRAAAAPSATSSTPQPSTSRSSSDALHCVALAKSDHSPSICAALCAVVKTRAPCHRRASPVVSREESQTNIYACATRVGQVVRIE